jgi:hypothetical protein
VDAADEIDGILLLFMCPSTNVSYISGILLCGHVSLSTVAIDAKRTRRWDSAIEIFEKSDQTIEHSRLSKKHPLGCLDLKTGLERGFDTLLPRLALICILPRV